METLNAFFDTIASYIWSGLFNIIGQGVLFAFLGLIIAILFINVGRRQKWFSRSFSLWTFVAKLNYIFLPVLFMVFGGTVGVLNGVHATAGNIIDDTSEELVDYSEVYITDFQKYLNSIPIEETGGSIADWVKAHLETIPNLNWISKIIGLALNTGLVKACMAALGIPDSLNDPSVLADLLDSEELAIFLVSIPSNALHTECDIIFWGFFIGMFSVFTPFFMLSIYEFILHFIVTLIRGKKASSAQPEFAI
ncbi:MAG: hypothetical protein ACI8X3_003215 [Saprospiraceae bacterium]|jgi:hypothetical protein